MQHLEVRGCGTATKVVVRRQMVYIVLYMYSVLTLIATHVFLFATKSTRCGLSRWKVLLSYTINTRFGRVHICSYAIFLRLTRTYFTLRTNVKTRSCIENTPTTLHTDKKNNNKYFWLHKTVRGSNIIITDSVERKVYYVKLKVTQFIKRKNVPNMYNPACAGVLISP